MNIFPSSSDKFEPHLFKQDMDESRAMRMFGAESTQAQRQLMSDDLLDDYLFVPSPTLKPASYMNGRNGEDELMRPVLDEMFNFASCGQPQSSDHH